MSNKPIIAAVVLIPVAVVVAIALWSGGGYGEVSQDAYQVAKALYGCCLAKSEQRLDSVEVLMNGGGEQSPLEITEEERQWLEAMIAKARSGKWESAGNSARRMMEDQVQQ